MVRCYMKGCEQRGDGWKITPYKMETQLNRSGSNLLLEKEPCIPQPDFSTQDLPIIPCLLLPDQIPPSLRLLPLLDSQIPLSTVIVTCENSIIILSPPPMFLMPWLSSDPCLLHFGPSSYHKPATLH